MAEPQDDYDQNEAMMNIITQYGPNNRNKADPEFDDGSQYLLNFEDEQELLDGHYIITEVDPNTGESLLPKNNSKKFVNHYGVLVRDRVPISIHE